MWCGQRVTDPCAGQGVDQSTVPIVPYARQGRRMLQLVTLGMREQGCWRGKNLPQHPQFGGPNLSPKSVFCCEVPDGSSHFAPHWLREGLARLGGCGWAGGTGE